MEAIKTDTDFRIDQPFSEGEGNHDWKDADHGCAALVVALLFLGRDLVSYVRTSAGYVQNSVTDAVPMEFQITRPGA